MRWGEKIFGRIMTHMGALLIFRFVMASLKIPPCLAERGIGFRHRADLERFASFGHGPSVASVFGVLWENAGWLFRPLFASADPSSSFVHRSCCLVASERMGFCASVTHSEQNIGFWHRALGLGASVNQSERAFYVVAVICASGPLFSSSVRACGV